MSETKSTETMIETCVLTLGELMSGKVENIGNEDKLTQCNEVAKYFNDKQYKLVIPFYQRAYVWSEEMVKIMLEDIDEQRKEGKKYLLGSLIIHIEIDEAKQDDNKNKENDDKQQNNKQVKFNIVDGQQRLTTLDLVLKFLTKELNLAETKLLDENKAGSIIGKEIVDEKKQNDKSLTLKEKAEQTIKNWFESRDKNSFLEYLKGSIEFVCVFTNSLDDAFIFFDSANAKGKRLEGYDLIKAFHLRVLDSQNCKDLIKFYAKDFESLVSKNSDDKNPPIKVLFSDILAPARIWLRDRGSLANATHSIIANPQESHIYNEFCKEFSTTLQTKSQPSTNSLGILQNFIGGADFFEFLAHFNRLYEKLLLTEFYENKIASIDETGFAYNRLIYIMAMIIYFDKFPNGNADYMLRLIARAVFSLRVEASRVGEATIKKYVKEEKILSLIYFTSYEKELENELKKFIDNRKDKESGNDTRTNATKEYLKIVQEKDKNNNDEKTEYERYDITLHPVKE